MSTQAYYKERLGFDPADTVAEHRREQSSQHGYEESLSKFKDERDAIQKKTFTKWVNKHLKKASRHVGDLFQDLRDGHNLISLLEVLSGEHLPRETSGSMRFHMLDNVRIALRFLQCKNIKLVNIQAEDIVDGNPKLTLGLIWTIILHFQISDIVVGQESHVTAKEALLRWARRSTARYPGVRVSDFTSSWRDGMAFSALVHRNRPDLLDWRNARTWQARERLERVFYVAEREYGVTRLLDPEDVDTPEPDEKSLITYISSLYDVFPEPPAIHPLYDAEAQRRLGEYRELASSLHLWMREKMSMAQDRYFPPTLIEMKKLAADSAKFKSDEVPSRHRDKLRLSHIFRELQKYFESVGEIDIEQELHIDLIEKNWNRLMMLHQERDQAISDEIKRLERLQRLAEKVHREMKSTENRLEELERRVEEEARRLDRLHPLEAKHAVDLLEQDIRNTELQIQNIFADVHSLTEGRYSQAADLHKRVQKLHQRWVGLRSLLHKRLVQPLSDVSFPVEERVVTKHRTTVHETRLVDTNPHFRALHDCIDWCKSKLKQVNEADYGSDLPGVQSELDIHQREHKAIEQFHTKVERCVQAKSNFHGEELALYSQHLGQLQKIYTELITLSNKRMTDLETLHDFIQSATGELVWLNSKEETEVTRDWSDKNLVVRNVEQYYESLMSDLEKREIQVSAVQDRGEGLVLQHHPASKTIEAYMTAIQSQWAWLLQLTLCLEVHLKHASQSQQFFREVQQAEQWISKRDEILNTVYSQSEFSLDEGERLLRGMQELRDELNNYGPHVDGLVEQAKVIVPMKQRRQPVTRPIQVTCICTYKQVNMAIEKNEQCTLYDNSGRVKWRVKNSQGVESPVPGVCFSLQPPDKEALDAVEKLRRQYERSVALWQRKQLRLRQNMIFATIKVVKDWSLQQFLDMGQDQRTAIRKALNEDAEKLLAEGDPSDPQLRRLRREMAEVNRLLDDFEKRARAEEESRHAGRIFNEQITSLQQALEDAERILNIRIAAPLPRDRDSLEHLVLEHKDYEQSLQRLAPKIEEVQQTFRGISLKTPQMKNKLDNVMSKWNHIWNLSNLYIERLKCVEIVLSGLEENSNAISELEIKLASFGELPSDVKGLQNVLENLMVLQNAIAQQQIHVDQLNDDAHTARRLVEKSRPNHRGPHGDMDRLDLEINRLNARWTNVCGQLVDRLRSAETAYGLAQQYQTSYQNEVDFVDESYGRLENLAPVHTKPQELETTKNLLNRVTDRAPAVEAVNLTGGRLIREGKIYGQKLRSFKEQLEELCPSLDASVKRPRRDSVTSVDSIARDLDTLNRRYTTLVALLQERARKLAAIYPEDLTLQRALQEQRPLRTFRTEFNIYESSASEERYTSTITHFTESQYERHESRTISMETSSTPKKANGGDGLPRSRSRNELDAPRARWPSSSKIGVAKEAQREESMEAENVINARGILHPLSKEMLTVGEAMSLGILDIRTGRIASSADGKSSLSIEEAARANLIDVDIASRLLGPCGPNAAGQRLSLLEAIQRELLEAERTDDRVKVTLTDGPSEVPSVSDGLSVVDAMNRGLLDPETGHFITATGDTIPIELAYAKGYLTKIETRVNIRRGPLALADAISQALIDDSTGRVVDRNSGEVYALDDALLRGIIDADVREIVSTRDDDKLTLKEAIEQGIINPKLGRYMHSLTLEKLSLKEARRRQLIIKPMSLKDASEANILDEHAKLMSPAHKSKLSILEAMARAVLDADHLKSVLNTKTGEALTLQDAIKHGIIMPEGKYVDLATSCCLTIPEAINKGYITSIAQKSIFDIDGFKDPVSEEFISLNAAMLKGLISHKLGGSFIVDLRRGKTLSLSEATDQGYARPEVMEMLNRGIGVTEQGRELSVLEAVLCDLLDPKSGQLLDPRSKKIVPLEDAIKRCLITPDGAALLTSLLNISVTTQTVTRTIKRYVTVTDSGETVTKDYKVSYEEVLRSGLINEESDEFTDPDTGKICSIHSAIREGLVSNPEVSNVEKNLPKRSKDPHSKQMIFETTVIRDINEPPKQRAASPTKAIGVSTTIICRDASTANEENIPHLINPINNENSSDGLFNKPGWILSDAIEQNLFDPVCGLISGPCVDHPIPFNECIKHSIIDLDSATAIDPFNNENLSLLDGLEKKILDDTGHYIYSEELSTKDAIAQDYIICKPSGNADLNQLGNKLTEIPITKTESMEVNISEESSALDPIQIERGIIYDPVTALVIFTVSGQSENLLSAVNEGNLKSDVVIIKDPNTGTDINISEAIKSDIFNIETGEYKDKHGKKVSLTDAARLGLITVVGTPLVAAAAAIEVVKQTMIEYPKTGEKVPREVAIERGLIKPDKLINESEKIAELFIHQIPKSDTIDNSDNQNISSPNEISKTITSISARVAIASGNDEDVISLSQQTRSRVTTEPKYKVTIGMAKSVSRSLDTEAKPIFLQRMRKKILKPCEALQSGIIDSETAKLLELRSVDKDEQTITLLDAINNKKIDANNGKIADLQRGDILSIKEAIERGILDPVSAKLIVPLTKSLSIPELLQQGLLVPSNNKIIHPESGLHLNLNEAILCEIVDPLSKLKISNGSVITLEKAIFDSMIDGKTGIVKTETAALNLVDAVKQGIFHYDDAKCSSLPLAGMTLNIEKRCIDRDKPTFSHLQLQTNQSQNQIINSENKILIDDKTSTNKPEHEEIFTGKDIKLTSSDVTEQYSVDVAQQKYPEDQIDNTTSTHVVPNFSEKRPAAKMNILEAIEKIYNADTETFEDPVTKEAYNFTDAMKVGLIDSSSILCDIASSQSMTTSEAVDKGLLDSKTGKIKNKNGDFISVAEATKLGLCAIVTAPIIAPYLAVKTIANAITSSNINRTNSAKVVILKKSTEKKSPLYEENMKTSDKCTKNEERQSNYNSDIFTSERFTDFMEPLVTTLIEAIENKRVDPKYCQIIVDDKELPYTVQETLERNQIDLSETIEIISRNKIFIVRDKSKLKISISKDLTPKILAEEGAYDVKTERFLDPESGNMIPFREFVLQLKVFDPDNVWVKDLSTIEKYVTLRESIEKPLIDRNIGYMVDPKSGKKINFFDAIQRDWILEKTPISIEEPLQLSMQDAVESGICDPVTGIVQNQRSRKSIDFTKSIRSGLIDMHTVSIRNPATDEIIPLEEAIKMGVFDSDRGIIVNTETKVETDINIAFLKGLIVPRHRKPISLEAIVKKGFYRPETGKIYDSFTSQQIDIEEGVRRGIVDTFITECRDTKIGSFISLDDALTVNLLNSSTGLLRDTKAGTLVPVGDAIDKGLIVTASLSPSLINVIVQEYYIPRTGLVLNPMTGDFVTIGKALESGFIDARMIKIKDERQDRNVKIKEATENDLLDLDKGILKYPYPMTLDIAYEKGYILSTNKPWSLQEALAHGSYDQKTGNFNIDSEILTLEQAITKGFINLDSLSIKEPRAGEIISLGDAIKRGLIDPKMGTANDPSTGNVITLIEALDKGLVVPAKRKISLPEAIFKGLYDPTSGKFTSPETKEKLATDSAIEKGIIDPSSVIVMDTKGDVTTFMQAIKNGIIDSKTGKVTNNTGQTIDFKEALENGLFLETHRPMSLSEAFIKGIFNEQSETFIDPQSGAQLTLIEAIQKYVIDPESISIIVKDARSGFLKKYTLLEAIQISYINGTTGKVKDFTKDDTEISLKNAYEIGLIVDKKAAISLQRAIHQGLYKDQTGKIIDPNNRRSITLHEAMRKCIINPTLSCYWDKRAERMLSLSETCRAGVIDRRAGTFKEPGANCSIPLSLALLLDLIIDIESASFSLYDAVLMDMYDAATGTFIHPSSQRKLTLSDACQEEFINPLVSLVKNPLNNEYILLGEAISARIVDSIRGTYNILSTSKTLNLREAREEGFIVPYKKPLSIEDAVKCYLYEKESGKFIDPLINEQYDLSQAIIGKIIDPETTVIKDLTSGQIKPLLAGLEDGDIDVPKGKVLDPKTKRSYFIDEALDRGLLVNVDKALTQKLNSRRSLDLQKVPLDKTIRECSIEEAIRYKLIQPKVVIVKDPRSGEFISLEEALAVRVVDPSKRGTIGPKTSKVPARSIRFEDIIVYLERPITFEEAVEKNQLILETAKFIDPKSKEILTLKESVNLGIIDPDSALIKDSEKKKIS